jgi:hypothetical protein
MHPMAIGNAIAVAATLLAIAGDCGQVFFPSVLPQQKMLPQSNCHFCALSRFDRGFLIVVSYTVADLG